MASSLSRRSRPLRFSSERMAKGEDAWKPFAPAFRLVAPYRRTSKPAAKPKNVPASEPVGLNLLARATQNLLQNRLALLIHCCRIARRLWEDTSRSAPMLLKGTPSFSKITFIYRSSCLKHSLECIVSCSLRGTRHPRHLEHLPGEEEFRALHGQLSVLGFDACFDHRLLAEEADGKARPSLCHAACHQLGGLLRTLIEQHLFHRDAARAHSGGDQDDRRLMTSVRYISGSTPISPPCGPTHWLCQGPPAESKVLAAAAPAGICCRPATFSEAPGPSR